MNKLEFNIYFALSLILLVMLGAPGDELYIFSSPEWHVENEVSKSLDDEQEEFEQFKRAMMLSEQH